MREQSRTRGILFGVMLMMNFFVSTVFGQQDNPITNDDIIKMISGKLGEKIILAKIKQGPCHFNTSTDALIELKKAGATDRMIETIVEIGASMKKEGTQAAGINNEGEKNPLEFRQLTVKLEDVKVKIGSEKETKGTIHNEAGFIHFDSQGKTKKWLVSDLLANHKHSWNATKKTSFGSTSYNVGESLAATLPDGEVVSFEYSQKGLAWWGPWIIITMMREASFQFLQKGVETYQPSGGRTEDLLMFRVLHVRPKGGLIGSFKTKPSSGTLRISLKTGILSYQDDKDSKQSFELQPSAVSGTAGIPFIEETVGEYFADYWNSGWNKKEFGVDNEQLQKSSEFIVTAKKRTEMFVFPFDKKISGIIAPSCLIDYIVLSKLE